MENNKIIIALAGKGGVGKTSLSASFVKVLVNRFPDKRILAIDADPAIGLSTALGIQPESTIDDIRKAIVTNVEQGNTRDAIELLNEARYRIFDTLVEADGFSFIAVGRPESAGCYCKVNAYLKEVIGILSDEFDIIVIDGEAGIEQINRRVMEKVSHLVLVTDPSRKGTQVVKTILKVADELVMYEKTGVVVNRMNDEGLKDILDLGDIPVIAYIPDDRNLQYFDVRGQSVFNIPGDSAIVRGAEEALSNLGIL